MVDSFQAPDRYQPPSLQSIVQMNPLDMAEQPKRARQRTLRACDSCRKMKIKCMMNSDEPPCEACKLTSRACKFEHVGIKRERPPSLREVEELKRRIAQLEAVLIRLKPQIDLSSLPRTNDQAKTMAHALENTPSYEGLRLNGRISPGPDNSCHDIGDHHQYHEEMGQDSEDEHEYEEEQEFHNMLKSFGECQLNSCQLLDQVKDSSSSHDNNKSLNCEAHNTGPDPDDPNASFIQQYCDGYHRITSDKYWPDDDLADKLISTYFEIVHPYPPVVHEQEFKKNYQVGVANRDGGFRSLCYAIFAAASPYSDDPRVLCASHSDVPHPRQSAGALFAHASLAGACRYPLFDLAELQISAILSCYMLAMSNPRHTFALVVEFLRRAVSAEAHLEDSPRWNTSFLNNQLRKRAFFTLIRIEKSTTSSLGYLDAPQPVPNLVSPPIIMEDETLRLLDEEDERQPTEHARRQFREQLYSKPRTPAEAAFHSLWSTRNKLASKTQNMILNQLYCSSSTTADDGPNSKTKKNRYLFILSVGTALSDFIENETDPIARWNPSLTSKQDLFATSYCFCFIRSILIRVSLEAISVYPELIHRCFQAAASILDVLDDMKLLGHLNLLQGNIPYFLAPVGLFFLWAISQDKNPLITADGKANAWLRITKCVEILNIYAPVSFVSEKLSLKFTAYMDHLKEDTRCPSIYSSTSSNISKKRPFSEIMAEKVEEPTISNLLFSEHASPVNSNSYPDQFQAKPSHITIDFSALINPQSSSWNHDANRPVQAAEYSYPSNQRNAYESASYSHLQLQNLLLQSANIPQQPQSIHRNSPLPVNPDASQNTSTLRRFDHPPLRSSFSTSTPVTHSAVTQEQRIYAGNNERLARMSNSTNYSTNYINTAGNATNDRFNPNFRTVGNASNNNLDRSFSSNSNHIPMSSTHPDEMFNPQQRHSPINHPNNHFQNPTRPPVPNLPHNLSSQLPDSSAYSNLFHHQDAPCNENATTDFNYQPSMTCESHPSHSYTQTMNVHLLTSSSTEASNFNQTFSDALPFAPSSATSASFPETASSPVKPLHFQPQMYPNQNMFVPPNETNHPSNQNIRDRFDVGSSGVSRPANHPSVLVPAQPVPFDGFADFRTGTQTDDQQIFSAICDTWLF